MDPQFLQLCTNHCAKIDDLEREPLRYRIGVYPQSDGRLAMIDIDESKGLVDLWEHFFVVMVSIHRNGYRWKRCFFGFD